MSYTGTKVGDTLTYTCNIGYIVHSGDLSQTCTDTAEWSGTKPECGGKFMKSLLFENFL
jgi:hypothetical protein